MIRLSRVAPFALGKTRLCLLRNVAPVPAEKQLGISVLTDIIFNYLANVEDRHDKSARLSEQLNKYRYAYFTSCVRAESNGMMERRWFRGRIQFEVFVSHVTSEGHPIWFVKAIHDIDTPIEVRRRLFMFGRVRSQPDDCVMSWFGTYSREGQASLRLTFCHHHLETDDYDFIEGIWAGRPCWLPEGDQLYTVSAFILHKSPDLSDDLLNDLMTQIYERAKIQLTGTVNPMNPRERPKSV